ncbi:MAG TPA: prolipoprotein diacylglyceryl transferase [Dehalococcoidia bacterium]|nr:prolipoprotein diacylglyceryl transferase [Dehalococcoidia bacterium]
MTDLLLTIKIGIDPEIGHLGGLLLTWHGIFIALGIGLGVWLGVWFGRRAGFTEDDAYTIALVGVPAGIIGARVLFVLENWGDFAGRRLDIFRINQGGISLYGALIGAVAVALAYGAWKKLPLLRGLDAAAFGMILGQGIGRIGCLVAGDIFAKSSSLPFSVEYTNVNSPAFGLPPMQFVTAYEALGDFLILGLLVALWKFKVFKRDGFLFFTYAALYSAMRFGISFMRLDKEVVLGLRMAQLLALGVIAVCIVAFVLILLRGIRSARRAAPVEPALPG